MNKIILASPGTTEFDQQGRIQGTLDIPLAEQGRQEAEQLAGELQGMDISMVYYAPCEAARQTAQIIAAALDVKSKKTDLLRNLNHGLWQGMLIEDVKKKQPKVYRGWQEQPENVCPPEGEMVSEARVRVEKLLAKIKKKYKEGVVLLVLPQALRSLVHSELCSEKLGDLWKTTNCRDFDVVQVNSKEEISSGQ